MVLGSVGWDIKESPESNLHVCGKDDLNIAVYNMERCIKRKWGTLIQFLSWRKPHETNNLVCVKPSWIVKSNRFSSGINLVLLSMLYKFIIWTVSIWAQSGFGTNPISVFTTTILSIYNFIPYINILLIFSHFDIYIYIYIYYELKWFCTKLNPFFFFWKPTPQGKYF